MDPQLMAMGAKLLGGSMSGTTRTDVVSSSTGFMDGSNWTVNFGAGSNGSNFTTTPTSAAQGGGGISGINPLTIAMIAFGAAALILIARKV